MVSHRLVQVFLACLPLAAHAANINDYFNVKSGGEDVGGCDGTYGAKTGHEWLQQWFDEARQSNDAAIQSIDEYGTKLSVRENLLVFMGIKPAESQTEPEKPEKYNAVRDNYRTMGTFLTTPRPEKPWIFCSAKWMQEKEWTDPVEIQSDERGSPPAKKLKKPQVSIREVHGKREGKNIKPYWMPDVKEYIFDTKANTVNFCDKSRSSFGATLDAQAMGGTYAGTITICMTKTTADKKWQDTVGAKSPSAGEKVDNLVSKSGTLYHEMFHLALGSSITPDDYSGYKALISKAAEWAQDSNWVPDDKAGNPPYLPEALVLFAEANWLTENKKSGLNEGEWWGWNGDGNAEKHPKRSRRGG